jgi:spermidine dehydrogenase
MSSGKGFPKAITRRDFVGGTMVGAGALLATGVLGSCSYSESSPTGKFPKQGNADMIGLGKEWDGPSGIGDYAGKNGNTSFVVNNAHGIVRNGSIFDQIETAELVDDLYDLVIVGAGISGLTAAWQFLKHKPNAKVLVLDQHEIFGGEAKQNEFEVDGYRLTAPQGSTGIVVPFTRARESGFPIVFKDELNFPDNFQFQEPQNLSQDIKIPHDMWSPMHVGWERADIGYYYKDKGLVKNIWRNGFAEAPISDNLKNALMQLELYRTPPDRKDWESWLDSMTYKQFLLNVAKVPADVIDDVCAYLDPVMASMGCGQGSDIISAYSAFNYMMPGVNGYSRYLTDGIDPTDGIHLATFPGGNTYQAKRFLQLAKPEALSPASNLYELQNATVQWDQLDQPNQNYRLRLGATVFGVRHDGDPATSKEVRVTYFKDGKAGTVRAKGAICAGQQHVNRRICLDLSDEVMEAMNAFHHSPVLVLNVALRNWKFLDKAGVSCVRWFEGQGWWLGLRRNLVLNGKETQPLDPNKPVVLTQYIPFTIPGEPFPDQCTKARQKMFEMPFAEIEANVRSQFNEMFGPYGFDDKRDIAGIIANRQGHAYVVAPPGFFFGKDGKPAPKEVLKKPFHRIAFSHSELFGAQMWESAADEGARAAKQMSEIIA